MLAEIDSIVEALPPHKTPDLISRKALKYAEAPEGELFEEADPDLVRKMRNRIANKLGNRFRESLSNAKLAIIEGGVPLAHSLVPLIKIMTQRGGREIIPHAILEVLTHCCDEYLRANGSHQRRTTAQKRADNYLRLCGVLGLKPYSFEDKDLLKNKRKPNPFARTIGSNYSRFIRGKHILEGGPGPGYPDSSHLIKTYGAASATLVDSSVETRKLLEENILRDYPHVQRVELFSGLRGKVFYDDRTRHIFLPPPMTIREFLRLAIEAGKSYDTFYNVSTLHYRDDKGLISDVRNIIRVLTEGGLLAFALKSASRGGKYAQQGIHLDLEDGMSFGQPAIAKTLWLSDDGFIRCFRHRDRLEAIIHEASQGVRKTEVLLFSEFILQAYEAEGEEATEFQSFVVEAPSSTRSKPKSDRLKKTSEDEEE